MAQRKKLQPLYPFRIETAGTNVRIAMNDFTAVVGVPSVFTADGPDAHEN